MIKIGARDAIRIYAPPKDGAAWVEAPWYAMGAYRVYLGNTLIFPKQELLDLPYKLRVQLTVTWEGYSSSTVTTGATIVHDILFESAYPLLININTTGAGFETSWSNPDVYTDVLNCAKSTGYALDINSGLAVTCPFIERQSWVDTMYSYAASSRMRAYPDEADSVIITDRRDITNYNYDSGGNATVTYTGKQSLVRYYLPTVWRYPNSRSSGYVGVTHHIPHLHNTGRGTSRDQRLADILDRLYSDGYYTAPGTEELSDGIVGYKTTVESGKDYDNVLERRDFATLPIFGAGKNCYSSLFIANGDSVGRYTNISYPPKEIQNFYGVYSGRLVIARQHNSGGTTFKRIYRTYDDSYIVLENNNPVYSSYDEWAEDIAVGHTPKPPVT